MRKNPELFSKDEFKFLHRVLVKNPGNSRLSKNISNKRGHDLDKNEIDYVKKQFKEWSSENDVTEFLEEFDSFEDPNNDLF